MELNLANILLITAVLWSVALIYSLILGRQKVFSGWLALALLTLAASGCGWLYFPRQAGYVSGALMVLGLAPLLLSRAWVHAINHGNFAKAHRIAFLMVGLHPLDGFPLLLKVVGALRSAPAGEFAAAEALLDRLKRQKSPEALNLAGLIMRLQGRDAELIEFTGEVLRSGPSPQAVQSILTFRVRAFAETGRLAEAIGEYQRLKAVSPPRIFEAQRYRGVDLCLAAFSGRVAHTEKLIRMLTRPGTTMHELWMLTARKASGEDVQAELQALLARERNDVYRRAIGRRIASDLAGPVRELAPENQALLVKMEEEAEQKLRYGRDFDPNFKPRMTHALLWLIGAVYIVQVARHSETNPARLLRMGALTADAVRRGDWWPLLAYNFLHFGRLHVCMNLIGLALLGPFVERLMGRLKFLIAYLGAGVCAGVVYVLLSRFSPSLQGQIVLGASGALMGVVGATGAVLLRGWLAHKAPIARTRFKGVVFIVAVQIVFDQSFPQVSSLIHVLGMLSGFLIAFALYRGKTQQM